MEYKNIYETTVSNALLLTVSDRLLLLNICRYLNHIGNACYFQFNFIRRKQHVSYKLLLSILTKENAIITVVDYNGKYSFITR